MSRTVRSDLEVAGALTKSGSPVVTKADIATGRISIPAGALIGRNTNGAVREQVEAATNLMNEIVLDFANGASALSADLLIPEMPADWDGGTLLGEFLWRTTATSGSVVWQMAARSYGDSETIDQALGSVVTVTDAASGTASQNLKSGATGAMTAAGTPAAGEALHVRVFRDPAHGSDTLAATARLRGMALIYTRQ